MTLWLVEDVDLPR